MLKLFTLLSVSFCFLTLSATTYKVGSTQSYVSPNALYKANVIQNGDTIDIDGETYTGNASIAYWNFDNLLIRGVNGQPKLVANGSYVAGKGIWVAGGDNITIDNIAFEGAAVPDKNGAGIRLDGNGLTVRNCLFKDNENGILTNNSGLGTLTVEYSEFINNGHGDGYSHNLYVGHINKLVFQYNYSHHAKIGHNLKSRAAENYILYNRIMDESTGTSSRLIDLPNGGFSIVMGNVLMQGPNAPNNNLVGYGMEGLTNTVKELHFINNTLVNKRSTCLFLDIKAGATVVDISNNIFAGKGTMIRGTATTTKNNVTETSIADVKFVDESNYDYSLESTSPAVDYGVAVSEANGNSLTPSFSYTHPTDGAARVSHGTIDAGAYEYASSASIDEYLTQRPSMYPNPFRDNIHVQINNSISHISVYSLLGHDCTDIISISNDGGVVKINTSKLQKGMYVFHIDGMAIKANKL